MSDTQFALPSDAVPSVYLPVQMTPVLSWEVLQRVVRGLQANGPTALESLIDEDIAPGGREVFARAREETDSPYVLPQSLMFPEDLYPMCFQVPHADDTIELEITDDEGLRALRSVLSGEWQEAELGPSTSDSSWVQWRLAWDATSGEHDLRVRATDGEGETQTEEEEEPYPDGATGYHEISVEVD